MSINLSIEREHSQFTYNKYNEYYYYNNGNNGNNDSQCVNASSSMRHYISSSGRECANEREISKINTDYYNYIDIW